MSVSVLGKRYANALLQLASDADVIDRAGRDLRDFASAFAESRELRGVFENPQVGQSSRHQILRDIAQNAGMHELVRDTLLVLSDRQRIGHVGEVADAYEAMAEARSGKLRAELVSASALPESYFQALETTLREATGRDVVVVRKVDPTLIGGVVARVGDQVFDGSVKNRLSELETELLR
jgi:F-type H+-transporting ATPase subunit delta